MSKKIELAAQSRTHTARQTRGKGAIPAILYGHGIKNQSVEMDAKKFTRAFAESGYTSLVNLLVGTSTHNVLVREVQFHPLKNIPTHVDFYQVRLDEKVKADVPLNFTGESPAVKDLSGVLVKNLDAVEVEALPQDLPHDIPVDISTLTTFESVIHISDLSLPSGVEVLHQPDDVVALVQPPRSEQELESLAEEVKEDVEAVEGVEKKEKEEEPAESVEGEAAGATPEAKKE